MVMIIVPPGAQAGEDVNCIKIQRTADARYSLITSSLVQCDSEEEDEEAGSSEAVISSEQYPMGAEAEAAGLAWASSLCVATIIVEKDEASGITANQRSIIPADRLTNRRAAWLH